MSSPYPDDLCRNCPYQDYCDLVGPEDRPGGCERVSDWRDDMERQAEGER